MGHTARVTENLTEDVDHGFVGFFLPEYSTVFSKNPEGTLETISATQLKWAPAGEESYKCQAAGF